MSTDALILRDATPADHAALVRFMAALQDLERATEPNRTPGAEMAASHLAALSAWAAAAAGGCVLVAEVRGAAAGFLVAGVDEELGTYVPPETRRVGRISDLWVEPQLRGCGIARSLIAEAERRLRAAGIRRVEISAIPANQAALSLYRRLGYADCLVTVARSL